MDMKKVMVAGALVAAFAVITPPLATAEPTPTPSPTSTVIRTPIEQYKYDREIYLNEVKARDIAIRQINAAFKSAIEKSTQDYKAAISTARSPDQKVLAIGGRKSAITAAISQRDAAIAALGEEPTPPVEPSKTSRFKAPKEQTKGKNR